LFYRDALKIHLLYKYAEAKTGIYVSASRKHILPGVQMLGDLCVAGDPNISLKEGLETYYHTALKGIRDFAEQVPVCYI
jgi:hypothetical protein